MLAAMAYASWAGIPPPLPIEPGQAALFELDAVLVRGRGAAVAPPDVAGLLRDLRAAGIPAAVIAPAAGGEDALRAAGLASLVQVVSGEAAPATFAGAALRLAVPPSRAVCFVATPAAARAALAVGPGWVVGIHRAATAEDLLQAGAHVAAPDLARVAVLRRISSLPPALEHTGEILQRARGRSIVVFLDCDGTLAPIVVRAPDARVPDATRRAVERVARLRTVAVVSGRDMASLRAIVNLAPVLYAAEHGLEIEGPGGERFEHPGGAGARAALDEVTPRLQAAVAGVPGAWIELKRFSRAVHHREVEEALVPALEAGVRRIAGAEPRLRLREGKRVLELGPAVAWDKGRAVLWLLERLGLRPGEVHALYAGDDLTDEDAFLAITGHGTGLLVRGGADRLTAAHLALADPAGVRTFLDGLAGALEEQG